MATTPREPGRWTHLDEPVPVEDTVALVADEDDTMRRYGVGGILALGAGGGLAVGDCD